MPLTFTDPPPIHAPANPTTLAGRLLRATTPPASPAPTPNVLLPTHPETNQTLLTLLTDIEARIYPLRVNHPNNPTHNTYNTYNRWRESNYATLTNDIPILARRIAELAAIPLSPTVPASPPPPTPSYSIYTEEQLTHIISELSTPAPNRGHIVSQTHLTIDIEFPPITFFDALVLGPFRITLDLTRLKNNLISNTTHALVSYFSPATPPYNPSFTLSQAHPHVNSAATPCFGNFQTSLTHALRTCNLRELLSLLYQWVTTYNNHNPYPGRGRQHFTSLPSLPPTLFLWPHPVEALNAPQDSINHGETQIPPEETPTPHDDPSPPSTETRAGILAASAAILQAFAPLNPIPPRRIQFMSDPDPPPTPNIQFLPPTPESEPDTNLTYIEHDPPEPDDDDA